MPHRWVAPSNSLLSSAMMEPCKPRPVHGGDINSRAGQSGLRVLAPKGPDQTEKASAVSEPPKWRVWFVSRECEESFFFTLSLPIWRRCPLRTRSFDSTNESRQGSFPVTTTWKEWSSVDTRFCLQHRFYWFLPKVWGRDKFQSARCYPQRIICTDRISTSV